MSNVTIMWVHERIQSVSLQVTPLYQGKCSAKVKVSYGMMGAFSLQFQEPYKDIIQHI